MDRQNNNRNDSVTGATADTQKAAVKSMDEQESSMDRAAALLLLGLGENANSYSIDNRFWQLTKRYRAEKNDAKLQEITAAYEVASGRAAEKQAEKTITENAGKYFGKTVRQWKVYFYYTWWKYLIGAVCIAVVLVLANQVFFGKDYDLKVVSIGHFTMDTAYISDYAENELGYQNPYVVSADRIVDGSEQESTATMYGAAAASAYISLEPDVLITDAKTMPYYLPDMISLDDYYAELKLTLPADVFNMITPVTCSMMDYYTLTAEDDEETEYTAEDNEDHIYGLQISDPKLFQSLGYVTEWSGGDEALVFSICTESDDVTAAEKFILSVLESHEQLVSAFEAANGPIVTPAPAETSSGTGGETAA